MGKLGFPKKLVKLCRMLHNEMYVKFRNSKDLSSKFKVNKCLRQEEETAPFLLNTMLEICN